jgi:hypothetical protein
MANSWVYFLEFKYVLVILCGWQPLRPVADQN